MDFIDLIKQSAKKKIIYTIHALDEMKLAMENVGEDERGGCGSIDIKGNGPSER